MKIRSIISRIREHIGYYRLTKRFTKLKLPELSKEEKKQIRETWPGLHIYDIDFLQVRVFKKIHGFSPYYLNPLWYNELRQYFNPKDQLYSLENKALCDIYFPSIKFPEVYVRKLNGLYYDKDMRLLSESEAVELLKESTEFVIKPAIGTLQGDGVKLIKGKSCEDIQQLLRDSGKDLIMQALIVQAPEIKMLNPSSLNCFRVTTMYFNGKFDFATSLKVGKAGVFVDNWNSAYWIKVDKDGILGKYGYDYMVNAVDKTDNGIAFEGMKMPEFSKMTATLEHWHKKLFANCCVIGWDVTIDDKMDIMVIETNLWDPGTNIEQFVSGDFFRQFHDDMLGYLKNK